jgi:predicted ATPase with chaperone activity
LSEETEKTTIPGSKKIVRAFNENDEPLFDALYLDDEEVPESSDRIFDRVTGQTFSAPKLQTVTQLLFQNGQSQLG